MPERDLIYDVGMCDGADTAYYLAKGFRVVAIEANPILVERAHQQFAKDICDGRLTIIGKAIGRNPGMVAFGIHESNDDWGSSDPSRLEHFGSAVVRKIEVECVTLNSVMGRHGVPYYLKIDIEGHDVHAVESIGLMADRSEAISPLIIERLYEFGYRRFMLVDQAAKNLIRLRRFFRRNREGSYVHITFTDRHSGPFGKEVPGEWISFDQISRQYRNMVSAGTLTWHDFHATP